MEFTMKLRRLPGRSRSSPQHAAAAAAPGRRRVAAPGARRAAPARCLCGVAQEAPLLAEFQPVWMELRKNNQLCDGTVRCNDGTEFRIHRAILSVASPYFRAYFTNSIRRDEPEPTEAFVNATGAIFKLILDYAYSGSCEVKPDNVEALLVCADQYEVLGVLKFCCQYILDHLHPSNCLGILRFGRQYFCRDLEERGRLYVRRNFERVLASSDELVELNVLDLADILSDDELNVRGEETVFAAIEKWVGADPETRKVYLFKLLKCVRLGMLSQEFVATMMAWPPIMESEVCYDYLLGVLSAMKALGRDEVDCADLYRPRVPHEVLFAVGGWSAGSPTNFVETYDSKADRWLPSADTDSTPRAYHGLCTLRGFIYMIGGFDGNEHFNTVRCFDPVTHVWRECACMYHARCYVSVVMHQGKIYAMGGYNGRIRMNSVERYDPDANQWELITPMLRQRSDASAASLDTKIYVVGGFNGQEVMNSAEVYDPLTNQWALITPMNSARSGVSLVAHRNTLYAIGGFDGLTRLTTGERFKPGASQTWDDIGELSTPRSNFATAVLDDCIYAIGGFNGSTTISSVEYYDQETNQWYESSPMNLNRSALSACIISGLPNAKDYSMVGRTQRRTGERTEMQGGDVAYS